MLNKEVILNTVMKDDSQETGGTSTFNETLKDFMEEVGVIDKPISLDLLNQHLKTCGIKELYKENYPELFSYTEEDILPNFKNNYDFLDDFSYVKHNADDEYEDRKSTRLNSSHVSISYAVFCLKKKNNIKNTKSQNNI